MELPCMQSLFPSGIEFFAAERTEHQHFLDEDLAQSEFPGLIYSSQCERQSKPGFLSQSQWDCWFSILLPSQLPTWDVPWLQGSLHPSDTKHSTFTASPGGNRLSNTPGKCCSKLQEPCPQLFLLFVL